MGVVLAGAACTPISTPALDGDGVERDPEPIADELLAYDPETRPLVVGERVPDFPLVDADGAVTSLSALRDRVVLLAFVGGDGSPGRAEVIERLDEVAAVIAAPLAAQVRLVAVTLEPAGAAPWMRAQAARRAGGPVAWSFVRPATEVTAALPGALGVAFWRTGDGTLHHTFSVAVIDRSGRLADRFPGLDGWTPRDLVAAIDVAVR